MNTARRNGDSVDTNKAADWLRTEAVGDDGAVWSWRSDANPGHAYPEATALWLAASCQGAPSLVAPTDQVDHCAARLAADLSSAGGVGRRGTDYLFDSAVALRALCAHAGHRDSSAHSEAIEHLYQFIDTMVRNRSAAVPEANESRWSTGDNPHQLKVVVGLHSYARLTGNGSALELAETLVARHSPSVATDHFPSTRSGEPIYMHAALYAAEGLLYWHQELRDESCSVDFGGWLSRQQRPDGGIPAWAGDTEAPAHVDATAQAVRIWCVEDSSEWAAEIALALVWLNSMQSWEGALVYSDRCDHRNSWATLFTLQALQWARSGVRLADIL
ncbi:MAG: hypothetical protein ACJAYU_003761 [Bradymonadia bacterium]|jgi:hypothetical protein